MPTGQKTIDQALRLDETAADSYLGQPRRESNLAKTYGGHTFSQSLTAALATLPPDRPPISAHGFFLSPGQTEEAAAYKVARERDGRSVSTRSVRATQSRGDFFHMIAHFGQAQEGFSHAPEMPAVDSPEATRSLFDVMPRITELDPASWREEWSFLDPRYIESNVTDSLSAPGRQQLWFLLPRTDLNLPFIDYCHVAYISDLLLLATSLLPHGIALGAPNLPRATLSHSVYFHAQPHSGEWLLLDQTSDWAGHGRGLSRAHVFTRDGRLVASLVQEGIVRRRTEREA